MTSWTPTLADYSWGSGNPTFTNPTFGIDSTGQFGDVGSALANNPFGSSGGGDMWGALISGGLSLAGNLFGAQGQRDAASDYRKAAEEQAQAAKEAVEANLFGGFAFEKLGKEYDFLRGNSQELASAFDEAKLKGAFSSNPNAAFMNRQRINESLLNQQMALQGAMPGLPAFARFM